MVLITAGSPLLGSGVRPESGFVDLLPSGSDCEELVEGPFGLSVEDCGGCVPSLFC
jgi:hypothetical protein